MRVLDVRARIIAEVQMVRRVEKLEENWAAGRLVPDVA
jgi:hypothetical protein